MRLALFFLFFSIPLIADFTVDGVTNGAETLTGDGDGATGLITTTGSITFDGDTVTMGGNAGDTNQTVTNNGTLESTGSDGIVNAANGSGATITNNGTITANDVGINSSGNNSTITNNGTITAASDDGIQNSGNNSTIINTGTITAVEDDDGIENSGDSSTITNSGTITAEFGIFNATGGDNSTITNSGSITAVNDGILNASDNVTITNTGTITATSGDGIFNNGGDNVTITNFGTISSTGDGATHDGIHSSGANTRITNSATISAATGDALNLTGTNPTLVLKRPSNLQGAVHSTNALNITVEEGLNLRLALDADSNGFSALSIGDPFVISNGVLATVDRTGFAMQTVILEDLFDAIFGNIYKSRDPFLNCCFPCFAIWGEAIGSERKSTHNINFRNNQIGALGGVSFALCDQGAIGAFGGYSDERAKVEDSTQSANVRTYLGGLSYEHLCGKFFVGAAIAAGSVDWHNKRRVMDNLAGNGISTARADIDGWTLSAEVNATGQLRPCSFTCQPRLSIALRYAGLFLGDYQETGTNADISVKDRNISLLKVRGEFSAPHFSSRWFTYHEALNLEPYVGVAGRFQVGGNDVDSVLLGIDLGFDSGAKTYLAEGLVGMRGALNWGCIAASFNIEGMVDSANSSRLLGEAGINWRF